MRISAIAIAGFGRLSDKRVEPAPGLTVIRGPNEAGKTTLLAFTRAMLFGFETRRYPALAGGKRGGWLEVEMGDGGHFRIERYGERGGTGALRVIDANDHDLGGGYLATLLQGVEQKVYRNIFAFGLEELTQFERLTDREVAARMYGAGLGTGSVSAFEVENKLRGERDDLFKPGGGKPLINTLLRSLEEIGTHLQGRDLPREYGEAGAQLAAIERQLHDVIGRHAEMDAQKRHRERLITGWPAWLEFSAARADREQLGEVRAIGPTLLEDLGRLETSATDAETVVSEATRIKDRAHEDLEAAGVDEPVLDRRVELEAVAEASQVETARQEERDRTDTELAEAQTTVDAAVTKLGDDWSLERIESFDDSIAVHSEMTGRFRSLLDKTAAAVAGAGRDLAVSQDRLEDMTKQAESTAKRAAELEEELGDRPPHAVRERSLRHIETLEQRLTEQRPTAADAPEADLAAMRTSLDSRAQSARELTAAVKSRDALRDPLAGATATSKAEAARTWEPLLPPIMLAVAGVVIAVIVAVAEMPLWVAGVVAAIAVGGALAWGYALRRDRPSPLEDARVDLQRQLDDATKTIGRVGPELDLGDGPTVPEVETYVADLDEERRTLERDEDRQERAEAATREVERLVGELATAASAVGLPVEPRPNELEQFDERISADRKLDAQRNGLREQEASQRGNVESLTRRRDELTLALEQRTAESEQAHAEWQDWLRTHDLDPDLDRETAARVVEAVSGAKASAEALRKLEARRATLAEAHAAYVRQVAELAILLPGGHLDESDLAGAAALLAQRHAAALEGERAQADFARVFDERETTLALAEDAWTSAGVALEGFLAESEAADAEALRTEVDRAMRAAGLDEAIAAKTATLTALSGPGDALAAFRTDLEGVEDIDGVAGQVAAIELDMGQVAAERDELNQEAGALRNSRAEMEADADATELRQRQADVQGQLEAAAERWTVLALAHDMLARSRAVYEEAHRPAVVQTAERLFEEWTDGRYRRIIAPLGRPIEGAERKDGVQVAIPSLSRGTSEQLYLALRFGLVQHFVETSKEPLPVVMDDILVNFDQDRAARAARSIEELAKTCQIIYFTCHPTTPLEADLEQNLAPLEVS